MRLSDEEIARELPGLPGWTHDAARGGLARTFRFPDFAAAFGWMARVAQHAERVDHHPDWSNVWNRVDVLLRTHDAGGVTERDLRFAATISPWADQAASAA